MPKKGKKNVHNTHVLIDLEVYKKAEKKAKTLKINMTRAIEIGLNYFTTNADKTDVER
jgi:post-segregation antitoxin (ccd killing protein)